jgi:hypothetical protein
MKYVDMMKVNWRVDTVVTEGLSEADTTERRPELRRNW